MEDELYELRRRRGVSFELSSHILLVDSPAKGINLIRNRSKVCFEACEIAAPYQALTGCSRFIKIRGGFGTSATYGGSES